MVKPNPNIFDTLFTLAQTNSIYLYYYSSFIYFTLKNYFSVEGSVENQAISYMSN